MKRVLFLALAAASFTFASCDNKAEQAAETQAEQVEEAGEAKADSVTEATEAQADAIEDGANNAGGATTAPAAEGTTAPATAPATTH